MSNVYPIRPNIPTKALMTESEIVEHLQNERVHLEWQRQYIVAAAKTKIVEMDKLHKEMEDLEKRADHLYESLLTNEDELRVFGVLLGRKQRDDGAA